MTQTALTFSDVNFRYPRGPQVVEHFNFVLPRGSSVLLGPNGAGKTTLLRLAAGALRPRTGSISFDGSSATSRRDRHVYRRRVTMMPQQIRPIPGLSSREQVAYVGWLKGLDRKAAWEASEAALETVALEPEADRPAQHLSGGQLRRLGVAQAIVHKTDLLLMDEPTAGLDPVQRGRFRELIERLRPRTDLIVSTHQTEDILESYDNVIVLVAGQILFAGDVQSFLSLDQQERPHPRRAEMAYSAVLKRHSRESA